MPRTLWHDLIAGQVFTRNVVRGKCGRQNARHESVRLVDGEWWGESSRSYECPLAPQDVCPVCEGAGRIVIPPAEAQLAQYDGSGAAPTTKPCQPCSGSGYVPGPHWPYRWPEPPPLRIRT